VPRDDAYEYPSPGTWHHTLDPYRCQSVEPVAVRRCQLYRDHDGPHAHAWLEPRPPGYRRRDGRLYPWREHLERWDDARAWSEEMGERLRWCCLFAQ
jgi:hypothetical protein